MSTHLPIHIGLHKTGTTFLQHAVFPALFAENDGSDGFGLAHMGREAKFVLEAVSRRSHDVAGASTATRYISSESLSGRQKANYPGECYERFGRFVNCLAELDREPRILLFVREHLQWLRSGYMHQYRQGTSRTWEQHVAAFSREDLSWSKRVADLEGYPLLVVNYSDFRANPQSTVEAIGSFFEVDKDRIRRVAQSVDFSLTYNAMPSDFATRTLRLCMGLAKGIGRRLPEIGDRLVPSSESQEKLSRLVNRLGSSATMASGLVLQDAELQAFLADDWSKALASTVSISPDYSPR